MDDIRKLAAVINRAERIVAFTGAGFSVPSGIPDFRSAGGIYDKDFDGIPPEVILSHGFFVRYPERFYDFYRKKMIYADARPNAAHLLLADLERAGKRVSVVTQNIDGLHTAAGSRRVWELHGSVYRNFCGSCGKTFGLSAVAESEGVPRCDGCGGIIRPDVVLYGEGLDNDKFTRVGNIYVDGLHCRKATGAGLVLQGTEAEPIRNVLFSNVEIGEVKNAVSFDNTVGVEISDCHIGGRAGVPSQAK